MSTVHRPFDARIFQKEARGLAERGFDVTMAVSLAENTVRERVRFLALGERKGTNGFDNIAARIVRNFRAARIMAWAPTDIIHIHDPELLITSLPALLKGRKIVYDVHEFYVERMLEADWIPHVLRRPMAWLYHGLEKALLPYYAGAAVVTEKMLARYERILPEGRAILVRNFPNLDEQQIAQYRMTERPIPNPYIVHTGGAVKMRAFDVLVRAVEMLRERGCTAPLINIGTANMEGYTPEEASAWLRRAAAVDLRVYDEIPHAEAIRWVAHASVGYVSLPNSFNNREALPNKLFEYFLFQLPVVATAGGVVERLLSETGAGVSVQQRPEEIAEAFYRLMMDPLFRAEKQAAVTAISRKYTFPEECDRLAALYRTIINQK